MEILLADHALELLPDHAVWWPARETLLVADVHLGKDEVFRRQGLAVPSGVLQQDLERLEILLDETGATRLIILGDLVHAPPRPGDRWPDDIGHWRARHADIDMDLVLGNHDRDLGVWLHQWQIDGHIDRLELDGLCLVHEWTRTLEQPGLSGHFHPGARLRTRREQLRLPAFLLGVDHLILPAFGRFTGLMDTVPFPAKRRFVVAGRRIVELPRRG
jgi:DNA ligase-associated metallophosphoesterase